MSSEAPPQEKRRVGRPRKQESVDTGTDPKDQILRVAASLFSAQGIGEVSMLEIAQASGLAQSSLYYWFRRKELIVAELLQQINRLPLAYARRLKAEGGTPDIMLYRLVRFDVFNVCKFPLEITEVHRFAGRDQAAFSTYWKERRELTRTLQKLIEEGIASGCFRQVNAALCALTVIAQNESVQNWLPRSPRLPAVPARLEEAGSSRFSPEEVADFVASQTLAGLIAAEGKLESVRKRAGV